MCKPYCRFRPFRPLQKAEIDALTADKPSLQELLVASDSVGLCIVDCYDGNSPHCHHEVQVLAPLQARHARISINTKQRLQTWALRFLRFATLYKMGSVDSDTINYKESMGDMDIIFAGGGTAACIAAGRLAKANPDLKILLIEGGPNQFEVR